MQSFSGFAIRQIEEAGIDVTSATRSVVEETRSHAKPL
jgi:hypothetical protein